MGMKNEDGEHAQHVAVLSFVSAPRLAAGRHRLRARVMGMAPAQPVQKRRLRERSLPGAGSRRARRGEETPGQPPFSENPYQHRSRLFWALMSANGLPIAIRTRDWLDPVEAIADAQAVLARAGDITATIVCTGGQPSKRAESQDDAELYSLWFTLDGETVLVSGRAWTQLTSPQVRAQLAALQTSVDWGKVQHPQERGGLDLWQ